MTTPAKQALDATLEGNLWVSKRYDSTTETRLMRLLEPKDVNTIRAALKVLDAVQSDKKKKKYTCSCGGQSGYCNENALIDHWNDCLDHLKQIAEEQNDET